MTRTVLLTLGRLPKGLELARALRGAGCKVLVADPFGAHLSKPSRAVTKSFRVTAPNQDLDLFLDDLLRIVQDERVDALIPISEEALYVSLLAPRLPSRTILFGAQHEVLERLHDKLKFQEQARRAGLVTTPTAGASDDAARDIMQAGDWVFKPALGCGGSGVRFFAKGQQLPDQDTARSGGVVQQRIYGREVSSFTVARDGRAIGTVLYEGLVRSGSVATCFGRVDDALLAESWIADFVAHQNYSGFIGFDFMIDREGKVWPIECNPRMTSGVHFMAHEDLADSVLHDPPSQIRFKRANRLQEGHTTLLEAYGAVLRPKAFLEKMRYVFSTPDILWSRQDPWPFFLMTPMSWSVLKQVMFEGRSFSQATTQDIEWRADVATATTRSPSSPRADLHETVPIAAKVLDEAAP